MDRDRVIQQLLRHFTEPSYLEIGVYMGSTFHSIVAHSKTAVDPDFVFDLEAAEADPEKANCKYFEMSSDAFFSTIAGTVPKFDLVFIDGLHTFDQTLRDLLNSVMLLREGGIIVIDDVMPITFASSISDLVQHINFRAAQEINDGAWMGDVYRLVHFVRHYMPMFSFATVLENHGQCVLWKKPRLLDIAPLKVEQIARLDYKDFVLQKSALNILPFSEIDAMVAAARSAVVARPDESV